MGLFAGLSVPMSAAFVIGTALPYLAHGGGAGGGGGPRAFLLGTGGALTLVFVALSFLVAVANEDRIRGLGLCLGAWNVFAVVYDAMILMAIYLLGDLPIERPEESLRQRPP